MSIKNIDIAQINIKRLMIRDGIIPAQIAKDLHFTPQNASALLNKKTGITDNFARKLCDKYGWDKSEIYRDIETIGKTRDVNEVLYELITQLDREDKKTIARLMIRMLNKPRVALIMTRQIIEHITKYS